MDAFDILTLLSGACSLGVVSFFAYMTGSIDNHDRNLYYRYIAAMINQKESEYIECESGLDAEAIFLWDELSFWKKPAQKPHKSLCKFCP